MRIFSKLCIVWWHNRWANLPSRLPFFRFYRADAHGGYHSLFLGRNVEIRIFKKGHRCTPFRPGERRRALWRAIFKSYYSFKWRNVDPEICCCGERIGHGGSICHHGGCRSMKEYTIECATEAMVSKIAPYRGLSS